METLNKNYSVFLVDDDKMYLTSLKNDLVKKFKNIKFSTFQNGEECLNKMNDNPDIVILDYFLTNERPNALNGIDVLKKIKTASTNNEVIILSAQDKVEIAAEAIKSGAYEYVAKSESAFIRLSNIIKNATFNLQYVRENKKYVRWNYIIATLLLLFILFNTIYYFTH
jgi:two-component system OmpR family response regulator